LLFTIKYIYIVCADKQEIEIRILFFFVITIFFIWTLNFLDIPVGTAALPKIQTVRGPRETRKLFGHKSTTIVWKWRMNFNIYIQLAHNSLVFILYLGYLFTSQSSHCYYVCHIRINSIYKIIKYASIV
jgi:hypothetical protein